MQGWVSIPTGDKDELVISADEKTSIQARSRDSRLPKVVLLHTPVHASWLNQVEIYFSIVQGKVLTPNDFDSLDQLAECLARFEDYFNQYPCPFMWTFDRERLHRLLDRLNKIQQRAA